MVISLADFLSVAGRGLSLGLSVGILSLGLRHVFRVFCNGLGNAFQAGRGVW